MTTPKRKTVQESTEANTEATAANTEATAENTAAHTDSSEAITAAVDLTAAMIEFSNDVQALKSTDRRRKRILRVLAVSVAFDIALSVVLGWSVYRTNDAAQQAKHATSAAAVARNNVRASCVALNEAGAKQKSLWTQTIALPPPPGETADEKAKRTAGVAAFVAILDNTFAPVDCDKETE